MSLLTSSSGRLRASVAAAAILALTASLGLAVGSPASAASNGFIAAPNGMVGVSETITVNAPSAKGQVVTIGLQIGGTAQTLQTTIGSNGFPLVAMMRTREQGALASQLLRNSPLARNAANSS